MNANVEKKLSTLGYKHLGEGMWEASHETPVHVAMKNYLIWNEYGVLHARDVHGREVAVVEAIRSKRN